MFNNNEFREQFHLRRWLFADVTGILADDCGIGFNNGQTVWSFCRTDVREITT
jgi:hypothetical protein